MARSLTRTLLFFAMLLLASLSWADGSLRLTSFPALSVADGRSTTTISAEVRDSSGHLVSNGTLVVFSTDLGTFRENAIPTVNGMARAVLVASSIAGTARITATAVGASVAPSSIEFEFVASRNELSSAQEYIEVVSPKYMQYTVDTRLIGAAAPDKGVSVRYRDVEITADDIQLNIQAYEIRAKHATLKVGRFVKEFDELYYILNRHRGFGTTSYLARKPRIFTWMYGTLVFLSPDADGNWVLPKVEERYGIAQVLRDHVSPPTQVVAPALFEFTDISDSYTTVSARKAVVFPRKGVQFQRAEVYVANSKVMKLPLFETSFNTGAGPILTDQFLSVQNNQLALNYPYYLSLKPGQTSLLRFRTGESTGRSVSGSSGAFLDYELNWNKGDDMDGGLVFGGLGRQDWSIGARQYMRIDDRTSFNAQADFPAHSSIFGSANLSRSFTGFSANLSGSQTRAVRGLPMQNDDYSFSMDTDPKRVGKLPMQFMIGFLADSSSNTLSYRSASGSQVTESSSDRRMGAHARLSTNPIMLDRVTALQSSFSVERVVGTAKSARTGTRDQRWILQGDTSISRSFGRGMLLALNYQYLKDDFNDAVLGNQRVGMTASVNQGRSYLTMTGSKGLGVDRLSVFSDMMYRLGGAWRMSYSYTFDRYLGIDYLDSYYMLSYGMRYRDIGLTWSTRTKRVGLQFMNAQF